MKATDISNTEDIIDSRDVIARIEELRGEFESLLEAAREDSSAIPALAEWLGSDEDLDLDADLLSDFSNSDEADELKALESLASEGRYSPDWEHGETLIRESYFVDYAQQLAEDIGAVNSDATWPNNHIDWDAAARDLRHDYFEVDFNGESYLIRS